jgi:hypothetical protein
LRDHETGVGVIEALRSEYNEDVAAMLIIGDPAADRLRAGQDSGFLRRRTSFCGFPFARRSLRS